MTTHDRILDLLLSKNGGSGPPEPPEDVRTGDDGEGDDGDLFMQQAMQEVIHQALISDVDLHRDDVQEVQMILLARIAVELGVIRALMLGSANIEEGDEWQS